MSTTNTETTGFIQGNYAGRVRDLDAQEAELAQMEKEFAEQQEQLEVSDPGIQEIDQEEATFKKRYGDLRRYAARKQKELEEELNSLKGQVNRPATQELPDVPEDDEEYTKWVEQYPDAARFVSKVATRESAKAVKALEAEINALKEKEKRIARAQAELELSKVHPDWEDIRVDDKFHDWVATKSKAIQELLYSSETDFSGIADCLSLYKMETARTTQNQDTKRKPRADVDAADLSVRRTPHTDPNTSVKVYKESDIRKMSAKEYAAKEADIDKAMNEGRFVYDISGR